MRSTVLAIILALTIPVLGSTSESIQSDTIETVKNDLHPAVPLRDAEGMLVMNSGQPLSFAKSCGGCHDVNYIQAHSDHANAGYGKHGTQQKRRSWESGSGYFGGWNILDYDLIPADGNGPEKQAWLKRYGSRHTGGGPVSELLEMNCLLCHTKASDLSSRAELLAEGNFTWANSGQLEFTGLVSRTESGLIWNSSVFLADGSVPTDILPISKPKDANCGQCHGLVDTNVIKPLLMPNQIEKARSSLMTGQIFSPQKLNLTGLNLSAKNDLTHPFDVHSARLLSCVNCHYSLNNPVYFQRQNKDPESHIDFDPRRLTISEYLTRPLHQFAKGHSNHGLASVTENSLRRCEACHREESIHDWLPYKERHFAVVSCESCHIPELYSPTLMSVDWTLPTTTGEPSLNFRNSAANYADTTNLIHKFVPVLLPRKNGSDQAKLAPYNLVTGWFWLADGAPVSRDDLLEAFTEGRAYKTEIIDIFDSNGDGLLSDTERQPDTARKLAALESALDAIGISEPKLTAEITAMPINHNVVNGRWATKDCQDCHHKDSLIAANITLSPWSAEGITPIFTKGQDADFGGTIERQDDGSLTYKANANNSGFYVLGLDNVPLVDLVGALLFFGISLGVTAHAIARRVASRRRGLNQRKYRREYIYDSYERLWHWLQAASILILLATGLIIHKPHMFGIFSFSYMVQVHNVVGFILLANAALALFYNLASGEIRQYLPEPKGFIGRSIAQAMYYSKGIFQGDPHPLEKSREQKLNPLQQVTYLAILNLLLPAQLVTGVLIWGLQKWPELAIQAGGMAFLAPLHTLLAWAFAAFIVMHVYLTTTGHTPMAGIKSMISGWDDVEDQS